MAQLIVPINPHAAGVSDNGVTLTSNGVRKGRPPKFNNCLDLAWAIADYFETCDNGEIVTKYDKSGKPYEVNRKIPYTLVGMAVHIGVHRDNLAEYGARHEDFHRVLKSAAERIESQRSHGLLTGDSNTIGSIFYLKACHGWRDTPEQAQSGGITVVIEGGSTVKLLPNQAEQPAIEADYQTVSVALPHKNPHMADAASDDE